MISINVVQASKNDILKLARKQLKYISKANVDDYDYDYRITGLISLMGMMEQKETDDLIAEFLKSKLVSVKKEAALALIKNNKPVSSFTLKQIASDRNERVNFYDDLNKLNKNNLFPADFRSQQRLAESYIYQSLLGDDDESESSDAELIYIKRVEDEYKGERKRFYFFRVNFPRGEEDSSEAESAETGSGSYLAIAGPFELDNAKINIEKGKNITGLYYEEKFDGLMMDDFFKKFIEQRSKWVE